ncbi:MAG: hypothetical protein ACT4P7_03920 [Gemmatimonadaceae bacterium]
MARRDRVALFASHDAIVAAIVTGDEPTVVRHHDRDRGDVGPAVGEVLRSLRSDGTTVRRLCIALGPPLIACKYFDADRAGLLGLATRKEGVVDPREIFVGLPENPLRTHVVRTPDGGVLIAAIEEPLLVELDQVAKTEGLSLEGVVPGAIAIAMATDNGDEVHAAGDTRVLVSSARSWPTMIRSLRHPSPEVGVVPVADLLEGIVKAFAARRLIFRPAANTASFARGRRLALAVLLSGVLTFVFLPPAMAGARAARDTRFLEQNLREVRAAETTLGATRDQEQLRLGVVDYRSAALDESRLSQIARLTRLLPPEVFIAGATMDTTSIEFIVVGIDVGKIPGLLASDPEFRSAAIHGPITSDVVKGRAAQRAIVRIEVSGPSALPSNGNAS